MKKLKYLLMLAFSLVFIFSSCSKAEVGTDNPNDQNLSVMFVNAGKADAAIVLYGDKAYMIDTGKKSSVPNILAALEQMNIEKLDGVFLTHTHSDHIGGLKKLSQNIEISTVYSAKISKNKKDGTNKIEELVRELSLDHVKLSAGDTIDCFEVIGPLVYDDDDDNDNSLVMKLTANGCTLLFTGDMQFDEENTLLYSNTDLSADLLKVGNHGNPDATSKEFADAVSPKVAVISTDTSDDENSANIRVINDLSSADIYITQNYDVGIMFNVSGGVISAAN